MERSDARSEILHLLRLRYFLTERVYFHHAKLSSGAMISKAVELAVKDKQLSRDDLYKLDDWTLFSFLKGFPKERSKDSPIRILIERVEKRQLLKRSYILSSATLSARKSRDDLWRMYVFVNAKYTKEVAKICEETLGRENEFSPKKYK